MKMCTEYLIAIIGVLGTLAGTVLGFMLHKIKLGKLYFNFALDKNIKSSFINEGGTSYEMLLEYKKHNRHIPFTPTIFNLKMDMKIYNSSDTGDAISQITIIFIDRGNHKLSIEVGNPIRNNSDIQCLTDESLKVINIPGKQAVNIPVDIFVRNLDKLSKCTAIALEYKDNHFKKRREIIKRGINFAKLMEKIKNENQ